MITSVLDLGPLAPFHEAGVLDLPDIHVATALLRIGGHTPDLPIALGAALCVRALREGSVCVDVMADPRVWEADPGEQPVTPDVARTPDAPALPWPPGPQWVDALRTHPLVTGQPNDTPAPLRLVDNLLYLHRHWADEELVRAAVRDLAALRPVETQRLAEEVRRLFGDDPQDMQRLAAATATLRGMTILAGGPGTGKTTTVARLVALLRSAAGSDLTIAMAAPTGKAAARLQEAVAAEVARLSRADRERVGQIPATTIHRLLGWRPDSQSRFRHDRAKPLPHDVVIVDESSMISLPLMARLLESLRPDARLILVGDPDQLASVEAGAVLGDLVHAPPRWQDAADAARFREAVTAVAAPEDAAASAAQTGVIHLDRNYRFNETIAALAAAIRDDQPDEVIALLRAGHPELELLSAADPSAAAGTQAEVRADVVGQSRAMRAAASAGDVPRALAALEEHRVLCAHREGPFGVTHWSRLMGSWTDEAHVFGRRWFVGRPILIRANDREAQVFNGDTGVAVMVAGQLRVALARGTVPVLLATSRLEGAETLHAMTIHRGQGSQFQVVTVILPPPESPLLTRELLYTAVTRARDRVRIIGSEEALRAAIGRPIRRASGLRPASASPTS